MYIWILLATIMVALSFFNLSPRADKGNFSNEIKASSVINRFKVEHMATFKTMQCETLLHLDTLKVKTDHGWLDGCGGSENVKSVKLEKNSLNFGYIAFADNLPKGYQGLESLVVNHAMLCLNKPIEDNDAEYKVCSSSGYRYLISYAVIPDRWLAKSSEGDEIKPVPLLANYLSSEGFVGVLYGWTSCNDTGCILHGASTVKRSFKVQEDAETGAKKVDVKYKNIGANSLVWADSNFTSVCKDAYNTPCLFAYTKFSNNDRKGYCRHMYTEYCEAHNSAEECNQ